MSLQSVYNEVQTAVTLKDRKGRSDIARKHLWTDGTVINVIEWL